MCAHIVNSLELRIEIDSYFDSYDPLANATFQTHLEKVRNDVEDMPLV